MDSFRMDHPTVLYAKLTVMVILLAIPSNAQINTPCTTSAISSFTPCFNFITGSTANGGSPSSECCRSFRSLMTTSMDCVCMVVTANVPIPLPINRTLALSLPRACNTGGVPLRCKASGSPLPAPGPVLLGPSPPPPASLASPPQYAASPLSPRASKATDSLPPPPALAPTPAPASDVDDAADLSPASPTPKSERPSTTPTIRPIFNPSSSAPSYISWPPLFLGLIGTVLFKLF